MAASVIRNLSNLGLPKPFPPCFFLAEDEEETEEEYEEDLREDSLEDDDDDGGANHDEEPQSFDSTSNNTEMTTQLLRFAELISSDVQRYFGRSKDPDACDIYAERPCPKVSGRQRYYADFIKVASSGPPEQPEPLGPLAELFQEAQRKGRGLPMNQRRLPVSFWTEPVAQQLHVLSDNCDSDTQEVSLGLIHSTDSSIGMFSTGMSSSSLSGTLSSSSTPDFSDLLAHWATDRDNPAEFSCDYQIS